MVFFLNSSWKQVGIDGVRNSEKVVGQFQRRDSYFQSNSLNNSFRMVKDMDIYFVYRFVQGFYFLF